MQLRSVYGLLHVSAAFTPLENQGGWCELTFHTRFHGLIKLSVFGEDGIASSLAHSINSEFAPKEADQLPSSRNQHGDEQ
jgi:hypothetical protein